MISLKFLRVEDANGRQFVIDLQTIAQICYFEGAYHFYFLHNLSSDEAIIAKVLHFPESNQDYNVDRLQRDLEAIKKANEGK